MRYAIFADVHGNLEALEAVLKAVGSEHVDSYFCVGDIVGYGADPAGCLGRLRELKCGCVAGNHDWVVAGKDGLEFFQSQARAAVFWTQAQLSGTEKLFLRELPLVFENQDLELVHGTLHDPERFFYLESLVDAAKIFQEMRRTFCFVGHTHIPGIIIQGEDGAMNRVSGDEVERNKGCRYIVNVGSVGQPRDGNAEAAYCVYDSDAGSVKIKRIPYPFQSAQEKILFAGLPAQFAYRLAQGL